MPIGESKARRKLVNLCIIMLVFGSCLVSVACQTREQRAAAAINKCQVFLDQDKVDEAGSCFQQAIVSNPASAAEISKVGADAVFKKCLEFKDRKDFRNSIICLEGVAALQPDSANVNFQLADSYLQYFEAKYKNEGTYDIDILHRSKDKVISGLLIKPNDPDAHALYGNILKYEHDKEYSIKEFQKAVSLSPKTVLFLIYLAIAQEEFNENEDAIESYKRVLEIEPKNTLALYSLGKMYEKIDKTDEAIKSYEKLLTIKTDYDDAQQRLDELKKRREDKKSTKSKAKTAG